jgi:hypothetical protein
MNLNGMFSGGVSHVPGLGYVQNGSLGDDGSVMMISGLGNTLVDPVQLANDLRKLGKSEAEIAQAVASAQAGNNTPYGPLRLGTDYSQGIPGVTPGITPGVKQQGGPMTIQKNAGLTQQVTIFNVTLPIWAWLSLAALLGGAGGYYLGRR